MARGAPRRAITGRAPGSRPRGPRPSHRRLEPHALVINWPAWYLLAHDHLRGEPRTFRLDRFIAVEPETETFRPRARQLVLETLASTGVVLDQV